MDAGTTQPQITKAGPKAAERGYTQAPKRVNLVPTPACPGDMALMEGGLASNYHG